MSLISFNKHMVCALALVGNSRENLCVGSWLSTTQPTRRGEKKLHQMSLIALSESIIQAFMQMLL